MPVDHPAYQRLAAETAKHQATLVAVSKTKPVADILELYEAGHRDFGENYVNELLDKQKQLPADIRWHFIGHLQTNKVKSILPFVHLVHGVDSTKLLREIEKQASRLDKTVACLLQIHIADEESKFGLNFNEASDILNSQWNESYPHVSLQGLMGMATLTEDPGKIREEFQSLKSFFEKIKSTINNPGFRVLSMGMTGDYSIALEEGSTMLRIGSAIFGER